MAVGFTQARAETSCVNPGHNESNKRLPRLAGVYPVSIQ